MPSEHVNVLQIYTKCGTQNQTEARRNTCYHQTIYQIITINSRRSTKCNDGLCDYASLKIFDNIYLVVTN